VVVTLAMREARMSSSVVSSAPLLPAAFCRRLLFPPPLAAAAALRLRLSSLGLACFALGSASLRHATCPGQCWLHPRESEHAAGECASSAEDISACRTIALAPAPEAP
jgi:hypothetical protein